MTGAMLTTIEQVSAEIEVSQGEVTAWIEQRWVLPLEEDGRYLFDEADRARLKLIAELRRDMEVGDEAMPLILRLLDQIYTLRRALGELEDVIKTLPGEMRAEIEGRLRQATKP
jgi:chaperone modulatory protein CbpM